MSSCSLRFAFGATLLAMSALAHAVNFNIVTVDAPGQDPAHLQTILQGINNAGDTVGAFSSGKQIHGYLDSGGIYSNIDPPGTCNVPKAVCQNQAFGVNNKGEVVGRYNTSFGQAHGFVRDANNTYTMFDVPMAGAVGTEAHGINDAGVVVGEYIDALSSLAHSFVRDAQGNITELANPIATETRARDINDAGAIAGDFVVQNGPNQGVHGFYEVNGVFQQVDRPGSTGTILFGANMSNALVGVSFDDFGVQHAFERDSFGLYSEIVIPGALFAEATGINDAGEVVGFFLDANGEHGFLATPVTVPLPLPVPEPGSAALMLGGLGALGFVTRRRKASAS